MKPRIGLVNVRMSFLGQHTLNLTKGCKLMSDFEVVGDSYIIRMEIF